MDTEELNVMCMGRKKKIRLYADDGHLVYAADRDPPCGDLVYMILLASIGGLFTIAGWILVSTWR